jgi:two-component sensor histidine kinase
LQARNADAATRGQSRWRRRIISMSTIFRYLYRADLSTVGSGRHRGVLQRHGARLSRRCRAAPPVAADRGDPARASLSLALTHELITNATARVYAGAPGRIRIGFKVRGRHERAAENGKAPPIDASRQNRSAWCWQRR